ncbi:hypothetical protein BDF14DRAFT_1765423 [Spinellus fusiger]|nr:hypothetical protein BDF14DRAFT_1765423 [Spinellus fusiger]
MNTLLSAYPHLVSKVIQGSRLSKYTLFARSYATHTATETPSKGGFKSSFVGFLAGATMTSAVGYYYLLEEYASASNRLLQSVEKLQMTTETVRDYTQKIDTIEKELDRLKESAASLQQFTTLKTEIRKLYDTVNSEHLELKMHVWGIEQDIKHASKSTK